ncbi:MAG: rubrerythrin family protein [Clostridiales bacterium]|nr:rubrerythrin family protein [Clostridiales bacterium]
MDFKNSVTKDNLMRAFAGESQARNRYTFAASQARRENLYVIECIFNYTAGQEKEHAEIFYDHLRELAGENIHIDGGYPIDIAPTTAELLRMAQHNEYEEHDPVYKAFAETAKAEGFPQVAASFSMIADIEKTHGNRFGRFADFLESGKLFVSDVKTSWICLNCGHILSAEAAPASCPVCHHDRGYFMRLELSPFEGSCG